jgi:hypothetical protein
MVVKIKTVVIEKATLYNVEWKNLQEIALNDDVWPIACYSTTVIQEQKYLKN